MLKDSYRLHDKGTQELPSSYHHFDRDFGVCRCTIVWLEVGCYCYSWIYVLKFWKKKAIQNTIQPGNLIKKNNPKKPSMNKKYKEHVTRTRFYAYNWSMPRKKKHITYFHSGPCCMMETKLKFNCQQREACSDTVNLKDVTTAGRYYKVQLVGLCFWLLISLTTSRQREDKIYSYH